MNKIEKDAWYHCGHCGSLFQSDYGFDEKRLCEICQSKPGVGLWPVVNSITPVASAKVVSFHKTGEKVRKLTNKLSAKKRRLRLILWITLVWLVLLSGVVGLVRYFSSPPSKERILGVIDLNRGLTTSDKEKVMNQVLPDCDRVMHGFLTASTWEDRSKYIIRPLELQNAIEVHYKENEFPKFDINTLQRTGQEWIHLGGEWIVLTQWKDSAGDNEFDAVFRDGADGWKLDWLHFSRYSEISWNMFLAGEGNLDQVEFRLLARQYKEGGYTSMSKQRMTIVLAAPVWGKPKQIAAESQPVSIDLMSGEGRLLASVFELEEKNQAVAHDKLNLLETDGFIRVRAKVSREDIGGEYRLTINELKVCHWLDSDASGL